jgi:membrane-associated protease RseP (regulator of RpoE activity)
VPHRRFQNRWGVHILLFLLTVGTTTVLGAEHYADFAADFGTKNILLPGLAHAGFIKVGLQLFEAFWRQGLIYSASVLGILGAHEMGHYIACRRYNVDATLPFFLPFPSLSGTLGAVIKIREAFPSQRALFDIAVAGPIAGFLVAVPVLFVGLHLSNVLPLPPPTPDSYSLGEPLLFKLATHYVLGEIPVGYSVNLHPVAFAAWFGLLATAWNLLPFGQLDGGHLTYATLGDASQHFSIATVTGCVVMCFVSYSWILMTVMMLAMLYFLGPRHPRVLSGEQPLGASRIILAVVALLILVLCFMPAPIDPM